MKMILLTGYHVLIGYILVVMFIAIFEPFEIFLLYRTNLIWFIVIYGLTFIVALAITFRNENLARRSIQRKFSYIIGNKKCHTDDDIWAHMGEIMLHKCKYQFLYNLSISRLLGITANRQGDIDYYFNELDRIIYMRQHTKEKEE